MSVPPDRKAVLSDIADVTAHFPLPEKGVQLEQVERSLIAQALERTNGNQSASARLLDLSRYQLRYRMAKHGLR